MSFLDKIAAAVMPPESDEDRAEARRTAEAIAGRDDWLATVLDHHRQIESLFAEGLAGADASHRRAATKRLATLLTGHAQAEEVVLYPALADAGEKSHATMAYEEQAMTKVQLAKLEKLDPMSEEWREKLEHIQGAVLHHIYEEEGTWFPELHEKIAGGERTMLTRRFHEEFERYAGSGDRSASGSGSMQMAAQETGESSAADRPIGGY